MAATPTPLNNNDDRPAGMSVEEWQLRVDLAAAYRLAALYGWTDLNNTHFSARIPGTDTFLLNPFGMFFDEITASSLVVVDHQGNIIGDSGYPTNPAGFVIHGALHMAVPEANCIIHTHSRYGTAVSMQADGLTTFTAVFPPTVCPQLVDYYVSFETTDAASDRIVSLSAIRPHTCDSLPTATTEAPARDNSTA